MVRLTAVKPCARCKVPTIDPETGVASQGEPSDILATFRCVCWDPCCSAATPHFSPLYMHGWLAPSVETCD